MAVAQRSAIIINNGVADGYVRVPLRSWGDITPIAHRKVLRASSQPSHSDLSCTLQFTSKTPTVN